MKAFQWVLFPPTEESIAAVQCWLEWKEQQPSKLWKQQRNLWYQLNATSLVEHDDELWQSGYEAGKAFLLFAILAAGYDLRLVSQKLLLSHPGEGLQDDHCDASSLEEAAGCYSVLIYLTDGDSTAVPSTPYDAEAERICWQLSDAGAAKKRIPTATHPVKAGAGMVISHKVVHHGPRNDTQQPRLVLFQHWVPSGRAFDPPDADLQRVPYGLQWT
jgi:hypothetical protein